MYYPGQVVYVESDSRLGIYVGFNNSTKYPYDPYMCIFTYLGENGDASEVQLHEMKDVLPVCKISKDSSTKQLSYKTSFQKSAISQSFSDQQFEELRGQFLAELNKLIKAKWVTSKYEINIEP